MSSHHFIKEGQEPALLILDRVPYSLVSSLLEWSPLVVVTEPVLEHVMDWAIKVDVVVGGEGKANSLWQQLETQDPVKIVISRSDDLLVTALHFLTDSCHRGVHIAANVSDQLLEGLMVFATRLEVTLHAEHARWFLITRQVFRKWYTAGIKVKIFQNSIQPDFQTVGLIKDEEWYTTNEEGFITITSKGPFWLCEIL